MPETRAKTYTQNISQPYNKNKRTPPNNNNKQFINSSTESSEHTLLNTNENNNKKQKVFSENMETLPSKNVSNIVEKIILNKSTDNEIPSNTTNEEINKSIQMDI